MKKSVLLILTVAFFVSCVGDKKERISSTKTERDYIAYRKEMSNVDVIFNTTEDDEKMIKVVEDDFFQNLKSIDRDFGWKYYKKFKSILRKNKKTIYDLYIEHTEIQISGKLRAISMAKSKGMKEIKYIDYLDKCLYPKIDEFKRRYEMNAECYRVFRVNYNNCYKGSNHSFCKDGVSVLRNGEIWKEN